MIIYDASAFFERVLKKDIDVDCFILDLTLYELGNVILKHNKQLKTISNEYADALMNIIMNWNRIIYIEQTDLSVIYRLASNLGLTFYDAAYIYFAKKYGAILETCDQKLHDCTKDECEIKLLPH